jgi:hypothetical protein
MTRLRDMEASRRGLPIDQVFEGQDIDNSGKFDRDGKRIEMFTSDNIDDRRNVRCPVRIQIFSIALLNSTYMTVSTFEQMLMSPSRATSLHPVFSSPSVHFCPFLSFPGFCDARRPLKDSEESWL